MGTEQSKAEERNRQRQEQTLQAMVQKMKQLEARLQTPSQPTRAPVEPAREASERVVHQTTRPPKLHLAPVVSIDSEKPCSSRATQQVGVSPASQTSREASERVVHQKTRPLKLHLTSVVSIDSEKPCSSRATQQVGVSPASQTSREASERVVHQTTRPPKLHLASVVSIDSEKPCSSRATQQVGVSPASQTSREASERVMHQTTRPPKLHLASVVSIDSEKPCSSRATQQVGVSPASQTSRYPTIAPNNPFYAQRTEQLNTTREATASTSRHTLYPNLDDARSTLSGVAKVQPFVQQSTFRPSTSRATKEDFVFVDNKNTGAVRLQPTAPPDNSTPPVNKFYAKRDRSVSRTNKNTQNNEEDELNCRTCRNKYGLNIYQCLNGHSSCRDCKERGVKCEACGQPITNMRNIALEAYVAEKKTVCPNKDDGCCLSFKMADIEFHLKECPYSDLICPLAANLAENCKWRGKISQMATHFEDKHQQYKSSVGTENTITDFRNNNYNLQLIELGSFKFLAHLLISQTDDRVFMTVQLLGTSVSASKWRYEVHLYNKGDPRRKYQHTDVCDSHRTPVSEIFAESQCASIPISYAKSFSNFRNSLTYKIYIMKDVDNLNSRGRGGRRGRGRGRPASASRGPCSEGSISPNFFDDF